MLRQCGTVAGESYKDANLSVSEMRVISLV